MNQARKTGLAKKHVDRYVGTGSVRTASSAKHNDHSGAKRNGVPSLLSQGGNRKLQKERSISDLIRELGLDDFDKENLLGSLSFEDIQRKPDLWLAAFDNPIDFIEYCKKTSNHERELLERSRQVEEEIRQFVQEWTNNTAKYAKTLEDMHKLQNINDKLQEVIMEERTHCQHLVGLNDRLETEKRIMERKFEASKLLGNVEDKAVKHLLEKNPKAVALADKLSDLGKQMNKCTGQESVTEVSDPTVLADRVKSLEAYTESLIRQHREEVAVLKETISQGSLKFDSMSAQYIDLLHTNKKSSDELKEVLSATVRENLNLREQLLNKSQDFLDHHSKSLTKGHLKSVERIFQVPNIEAFRTRPQECDALERDLQLKVAKSEIELEKKSNLLRETVGKVVVLERKCARLEEEKHVLQQRYEHTVKALKSKNEVLEKRCEKTESRLKFGHQGVIQELRQCKELNKTLIRNVRTFSREHQDVKKKLSDCAGRMTQTDPEAVEQLKTVTTQTKGGDLRLHAMKLWNDYVGSKIDQIENQATSRIRSQSSREDGMRVLFLNPSLVDQPPETGRQSSESTAISAKSHGSTPRYIDMPPEWAAPAPSNYAFLLDFDQDELENNNGNPPPLV